MFPELRMIIGAAAGLAGCCSFGAEVESLPPIFAPRQPTTLEPAARPTANAIISDRAHHMLADVVQAKVAAIKAPAPSATPKPTASDVVMLDRFVVRSSLFKSVELPHGVSPMTDLLQHGVLFRSLGKFQAEGTLNFLQVDTHNAGSGGTAPKVELRLNIRW